MFSSLSVSSETIRAVEPCRALQNPAAASSLVACHLLPGESLQFALQSTKEAFAFTNEALIVATVDGPKAARRLFRRFPYRDCAIHDVRFETSGRGDRDCELRFSIHGWCIFIGLASGDEAPGRVYAKVLELLSRAQAKNDKRWDLAQTSLERATNAMNASDGTAIGTHADGALAWLEAQYEQTHPRCYREVIQSALKAALGGGKP